MSSSDFCLNLFWVFWAIFERSLDILKTKKQWRETPCMIHFYCTLINQSALLNTLSYIIIPNQNQPSGLSTNDGSVQNLDWREKFVNSIFLRPSFLLPSGLNIRLPFSARPSFAIDERKRRPGIQVRFGAAQ